MRSSPFLLLLMCALATAAPINEVQASWDGQTCVGTSECGVSSRWGSAIASASGGLNLTGGQPLVRFFVSAGSSPSYLEHRPNPPYGWDLIEHSGRASATAGVTFEMVTGYRGRGRIEADVAAESYNWASYVLTLAGTEVQPNPWGTQTYTVSVPLGDPVVISVSATTGGSSATYTGIFRLNALRFYDAEGTLLTAQLADAQVAENVPEPASLALAFLGLLSLSVWKRRRT